jgi:hypothetical protein
MFRVLIVIGGSTVIILVGTICYIFLTVLFRTCFTVYLVMMGLDWLATTDVITVVGVIVYIDITCA